MSQNLLITFSNERVGGFQSTTITFFLQKAEWVWELLAHNFQCPPTSLFCPRCSCGNVPLRELIWMKIHIPKKIFSPFVNAYCKKEKPSFILHKLPIFGDSKLWFPFQNNTWCFLFLENGDGVKVPLQKAKISNAKHAESFCSFLFSESVKITKNKIADRALDDLHVEVCPHKSNLYSSTFYLFEYILPGWSSRKWTKERTLILQNNPKQMFLSLVFMQSKS